MSKVVMRCTKIKSMGSAAASIGHTYRTQETPNADPTKIQDNVHLVGKSKDAVMGDLRSKLPEKRRKDAVLAIEYVMTVGHQWWQQTSPEQHQEFFKQSMNWLAEKYGQENIIEATIHNDEIAPHLTAMVVPLKEGKLNAFHYIGSRAKLRADQTSFAKCVEHIGLERGIEGSRAKHKTVKQFYQELEIKDRSIPSISPEELKPQKTKGSTIAQKIFGAVETETGVTLRLNNKIKSSVSPILSNALNDRLKAQRLDAIEKPASISQKRLNQVLDAFKGIDFDEILAIGKEASLKKEQELNKKREVERQQQVEKRKSRGFSR